MADPQTRLREVLEQAAPASPDVDGLADGARRYAARVRRLRVMAGTAALATVAAVAGLVVLGEQRPRALTPVRPDTSSSVDALACGSAPGSSVPDLRPTPLSGRFTAARICASTEEGSVWQGFAPPDEPVTWSPALDSLDVQRRDDGAGCDALAQGPAFWVVLQGRDGRPTTYANETMRCNGWPFLTSWYAALAEQHAHVGYARTRGDDAYPPCPSLLDEVDRRGQASAAELPRGTVVDRATICMHPAAQPGQLPRRREVVRLALTDADVARLNADLARAGAGRSRVSCSATVPPDRVYVLRAVTTTGTSFSLRAAVECLPTFAVNGDPSLVVVLRPATVDAVVGTVRPVY